MLVYDNKYLHGELRRLSGDEIIGAHFGLKDVMYKVQQVATLDSPVLLLGETGVGKDVIANTIHYSSSRSDGPFVSVNCGAIPDTLIDSELFGHEKGAFTGAYKKRIGRFEMANCGTIFLDEIGEMSPALQIKLLRVLQEQQFERVGGTKTLHVDLRFIAATNKNLTTAINMEKFREDLYYRLNVIPIKVPSLKQRRSDIPLLIDHFLKKFQKGKKKRITGFFQPAMDAIMAYDWPGNVRELENVIKRLTILSEGPVVNFDDLPENIRGAGGLIHTDEEVILGNDLNLNEAVQDYEKRIILEALEKTNWVKSKAAKLLNINRTTLVAKIKKQNIETDKAASA
jgi:transcriptional regulator with PAS, ATPase and Fis domain